MLYFRDNREKVSGQGNDVIFFELFEDLLGGGKQENGYMEVHLQENSVEVITILLMRR